MNVYERRNYPVISLLRYLSYYITRLSFNYTIMKLTIVASRIPDTIVAFGQTRHTIL
jgi:hypothetical protein